MNNERVNTASWAVTLKKRYQSSPTDPYEAMWHCETHGTIEPKAYEVDGVLHYVRQSCDCHIREQQQKERERQQREWRENQAKRTYSWLGERWADLSLRQKTFDTFQAERQPEAHQFTRLFAQKRSGTLILSGSFGTGKTHLLAALCNAALSTYHTASLFTTAPELFAAIAQYIAHNDDYYALVEKAARTPLLVIDDIDKAKHTDFREEIYFAIIDKRVNRGLPTAISTNRLDELASFVGGAVCSRLQVGQIAIEMVGSDYRKEL